MSGIYLIVWNNTAKDKCFVLKPTKGGYPHITLAYTGKQVKPSELVKTASLVLGQWALANITCTRAYVNSFKPANGPMRHDVLIEIGETTAIENTRTTFLRDVYPDADKFSMHNPHITHAIFDNLVEAEARVEELNKNCLPLIVQVTGVTID